MATRIQELIDAAGPPSQEVEVEVKGAKQTVTIRMLSGQEFDEVRAGMFQTDGTANEKKQAEYRARFVSKCLRVDGEEFPAFVVGGWPDATLTALTKACNKVNGIGAAAVKEAEKNSDATSNAGSTST
jgi:hypothetical protein